MGAVFLRTRRTPMIPTHQRTAVRNANLRAAPFFVSLPLYTEGSTDKFGTTILTHLFCPHFGGKSSTEHHSASGFPPRSDEKSTPIWQTSFYQRFLKCHVVPSLPHAIQGSGTIQAVKGAIPKKRQGAIVRSVSAFIQQPFFQILTVRTPHSCHRCGRSGGVLGR